MDDDTDSWYPDTFIAVDRKLVLLVWLFLVTFIGICVGLGYLLGRAFH